MSTGKRPIKEGGMISYHCIEIKVGPMRYRIADDYALLLTYKPGVGWDLCRGQERLAGPEGLELMVVGGPVDIKQPLFLSLDGVAHPVDELGFEIQCTRSGGWTAWARNVERAVEPPHQWELIADEWHRDFTLTSGGMVLCGREEP